MLVDILVKPGSPMHLVAGSSAVMYQARVDTAAEHI